MENYNQINVNKYTTIIQDYLNNCYACSKEYTHVATGEIFMVNLC